MAGFATAAFASPHAGFTTVTSVFSSNGPTRTLSRAAAAAAPAASAAAAAPQSDLGIEVGAPANVVVNGSFAYDLVVRNDGPDAATNVAVQDRVPDSLQLGALPAGCTSDGNLVICGSFNLGNGESRTFTLHVVAPDVAGTVSNSATVIVGSGGIDPNSDNNSASADTLVGDVDLSISKTDSTDGEPVAVGDTFDYSFHVQNAGPNTSSGGQISDTLPRQVQFVSASDGCTVEGQDIRCSLGLLEPDGSMDFDVTVKAINPGTAVENTATVSAGAENVDIDPSNDESSVTTYIYDVDVSIRKVATPDSVVQGENLTYTITASNQGLWDAIDVVVTDPLPASVSYVSSDDDCEYNSDSRTVTCGPVDIDADDSIDFTIVVTANVVGDVTNTASLTLDDSDVDLDYRDNSASVESRVVPASSGGPTERVLILDTTVVSAGGPEGAAATALGYGVDVVTGTQWDSMTTADFAKYRALILGDRSCGSDFTAAESNTAVWSAAVNGNVIINGTDPVFHGKVIVTNTAVAFATSAAGKTGAYISLSCMGGGELPTGTPVDVLRGLGAFNVIDVPCAASVHIVATHPALAGLTDSYLSNWGCSVHEAFVSWPSDFLVLAIAQDIGSSYTAADGTTGTPYMLARGAGLAAISDIKLAPEEATVPVGGTHTVTATVVQNGAPFGDRTVTFTVIDGPNAGVTGTAVTDAAGNAGFSYVGSQPGTDKIHATFVDAQARTQTSNQVTATWTGAAAPPAPPAPPANPPKSDLKVTVKAPLDARTGAPQTFTAVVFNGGPDPATGVVLRTPVPANATIVSASATAGDGCTLAATVTCFLGTMGSGASVTVTLVFTTGQVGPLTISPSVEGDYDTDPGNNSSSATATVVSPTAPPAPPPPSALPGTFNAVGSGTIKINGVDQPADQLFVLHSGDIVDVTNGVLTFTGSDGSYISVSSTQFVASLRTGGGSAAADNLPAQFRVEQPATTGEVTTLTLVGGDFATCTAPRSTSATNPKPVRQLWGSAKGKFRTVGRYSAATVRGTVWLTQDRCDGTLTQVVESIVDVLDVRLQKTIAVNPGESYLATPAPAAFKPPASKGSAQKKLADQIKKSGLVWAGQRFLHRKAFEAWLTARGGTWQQFKSTYPVQAAALSARH